MTAIDIAGRTVGPGSRCWLVAELSGNALGDYDRAVRLVHAAKEAGADAVKTACFQPSSITLRSDAEPFRLTWAGKATTLWDLYAETAIPMDWHPRLKALCDELRMPYFASVFSPEDCDFMDSLSVPAFKIASFELVDHGLIRHVASKGKPVILSTGMATAEEVYEAACAAGHNMDSSAPLVLLHCTSAYPAPASDANLQAMAANVRMATYPRGLSDHTLGIAVPVAAVALGAVLIERHFTLSRADGGPDAAFSLEPAEFKAMVEAVRAAEQALGQVHYGPTESERANLRYRRSLWVVRDIAAGEQFTQENVRSLRPADGLLPRELPQVLDKRAKCDIAAGSPLEWGMVK